MDDKDKEVIKDRILSEEDFIYCPRLGNSVEKLIEKNPSGVNDERIQKILLLSKKDLNQWYNNAIMKLRKKLNIKVKK